MMILSRRRVCLSRLIMITVHMLHKEMFAPCLVKNWTSRPDYLTDSRRWCLEHMCAYIGTQSSISMLLF